MNDFNDKLWKEIEDATEDIEVPESLLPENVVEKLKLENRKVKSGKMKRLVEMAAAAAVIITIGGVGSNYMGNFSGKDSSSMYSGEEYAADATMDNGLNYEESMDSVDKAAIMGEDSGLTTKKKNKTVGDAYHLAANYDEIYEKIKEYRDWESMYFVNDGTIVEDAEGSAINSGSREESASDIQKENSTDSTNDLASGKVDHSSTNLQQEGVDESDIVKLDGNYIYRVWKNKVHIIDIRNKKMKVVGTINVKKSVSDTVKEIYLDGDKLCLVMECVSTSLDRNGKSTDNKTDAEDVYTMDGIYNINSNVSTKLCVYNVKNRKSPVLEGEMTQDGRYYTSRKVNDVLYLFTRKNFGYNMVDDKDVIPYVQGKQVEVDCIYIPERVGRSQLIASSVNLNSPKKVVDEMVIMNSSAEVYMGQKAIYLYEKNYESDQTYTNIAKFSYDKKGVMDGVNATAVKGSIEDTFAISEKGDSLRVLTTGRSASDRVNQLYVLDSNMLLKGDIEDIAKGESIYAARYIGNMAYFITYRNTDPLFVADLSDESNPKLLGSVKISGFSEYLHPYGKNKLFGIGYETDKDSNRLGVKICMFDISNPKKPKVLNSYVLKDADETSAAYNYKGVFVDEKKNMIGFLTEDYESDRHYEYMVYSWKNGKFKKEFSRKFKKNQWIDMNEVRGMYAGDRFYIIKNSAVLSYEMKGSHKKVDSILLK